MINRMGTIQILDLVEKEGFPRRSKQPIRLFHHRLIPLPTIVRCLILPYEARIIALRQIDMKMSERETHTTRSHSVLVLAER